MTGSGRRDEGPDTVAPYDHTIFFQVAQSLAQGRARDAQALREFNLARQAIAGRVAIALHQISERLAGLRVERPLVGPQWGVHSRDHGNACL